jgi:hypothetical protein
MFMGLADASQPRTSGGPNSQGRRLLASAGVDKARVVRVLGPLALAGCLTEHAPATLDVLVPDHDDAVAVVLLYDHHLLAVEVAAVTDRVSDRVVRTRAGRGVVVDRSGGRDPARSSPAGGRPAGQARSGGARGVVVVVTAGGQGQGEGDGRQGGKGSSVHSGRLPSYDLGREQR